MSFDDVVENVFFQIVRSVVARWLMQRMNDRESFELLEYTLGKPYHVRVTLECIVASDATISIMQDERAG